MHILNNNALANLWRKQFSTYFLFLLISELRDRYSWSNLQMWLCSQNIIYYLNPVMRTMCSGLVSFIAQPTAQHRSVIWCYMDEMEMSVHQYSTDVVIFWRTYLTPTWYVFRVRLLISCVQMRLGLWLDFSPFRWEPKACWLRSGTHFQFGLMNFCWWQACNCWAKYWWKAAKSHFRTSRKTTCDCISSCNLFCP